MIAVRKIVREGDGELSYDIECNGYLISCKANEIYVGIVDGELSAEEAMELGGIIKLAGEASKQLDAGSPQTVLDLYGR